MRMRRTWRQRLPHTPYTMGTHDLYTASSKWALSLLFLTLVHVHGLGVLPPTSRTAPRTCAPYQSTHTTPTTSLPHNLLFARKKKRKNDGLSHEQDERQRLEDEMREKKSEDRKHLEGDIAKRLSLSKDKAISALSQPSNKRKATSALSQQPNGEKRPNKNGKPSNRRTTMKRPTQSSSSLLPAEKENAEPSNKKPWSDNKKASDKASSFSSLLPPPLPSLKSEESESMSSGLSSWEEFLGRADPASSRADDKRLLPRPAPKKTKKQGEESDTSLKLPSISDLFPPDFSSSTSSVRDGKEMSGQPSSSGQLLDGVLPVSALFYRSSQALSTEDEELQNENDQSEEGDEERDDEELPFSAEQSDELSTDGNKVRIRRNRAETNDSSNEVRTSKKKTKAKKNGGRKLVRRGMEMFLGGTPINADPPQRSVELTYRVPQEGEEGNWGSVITLNTRDFGPLLDTAKADVVSRVELGLFCEHFVSAAMKWDICPKDLRAIVKSHTLQQNSASTGASVVSRSELVQQEGSEKYTNIGPTIIELTESRTESTEFSSESNSAASASSLLRQEDDEDSILSLLRNVDEAEDKSAQAPTLSKDKFTRGGRKGADAAKGFGKKPEKSHVGARNVVGQRWRMVGFNLMFSIRVSKEELLSGDADRETKSLQNVLTRGIRAVLKSKSDGLVIRINKMKLSEGNDFTTVAIEFSIDGKGGPSQEDLEKRAARVDAALCQAMDDGDFALALAAAAREESSWPAEVRDRVVEEFLFEDDEEDGSWEDPGTADVNGAETKKPAPASSQPKQEEESVDLDAPFGTPDSPVYSEDDMFLGGGNDGVFFDYSEANASNSPFKGELGPLLVDAVTTRAVQRHPRVIAIGDVHGCIDELQDLLRLCDYRPGDLVVFLGDLVSKGPDSISVVQMAREIGAISIRGNHDFEVIRWHQAIKSGVDPPVVGSEHFHVASCLTQADMKWMYSLPWYISSKELGVLFVHAGFVSGIRLAKQNPRLMMNMRSILPDGTVTSKFFNNWPWARLWDGPQTVLFGHDADRGLQQYEHAIGLDTGCVYGGRLTACILPEKRLVSVSARREYFRYRRKHYD